MNRKLIMGALAGAAAIALAVGGTTYSAFSDYGDTNGNHLGAGFLKLDLGANGTGNTALDFGKMAPGPNANPDSTGRQIWIASNDGQSVPTANLFLTLHNLQDTAAPCSTSLGKASGEAASGVGGCTIDPTTGTASGTPAQGNLSHVLSFQGFYYPTVTSPAACAALNPNTFPSSRVAFLATQPGDLNPAAVGAGTRYELTSGDLGTGAPIDFQPGQAGCIGIVAFWIANPATTGTVTHPTDNAAQADSMSFDVHFDLVQDLTAALPGPVQGP